MVDCEVLLARERAFLRDGGSPGELAEAEAPLRQRLERSATGPATRLRSWVQWHRERDQDLPGRRLSDIRLAASVVACLLGAGFCFLFGPWGVFGGGDAVNLFHLVAVFVLAPVVLLLAGVVIGVLAARAPRAESLSMGGPLQGLLAMLGRLWVRACGEQARRGSGQRAALAGLLQVRHRRLWSNLITAWLQVGALAYGICALATLFLILAFSAQEFRWGSSLGLEAEHVVRAVAAPWRWTGLVRVPDPALVAMSREGSEAMPPAMAEQARIAWSWFLLGAVLMWAVIPRCVYLGVLLVARRRSLSRFARTVEQVGDYRAVLARLRAPSGGFAGDATESSEPEQPADASRVAAVPGTAGVAIAVRWDEADADDATIAAAVERALRMRVVAVVDAGGGVDVAGDAIALDRLTTRTADELPAGVVVVDGDVQPLAGLCRFLASVRARVGRAHLLCVLLLDRGDVRERNLQAWHEATARIGGAWRVERVAA